MRTITVMIISVLEQHERITRPCYQNGLTYESYFSPYFIGICLWYHWSDTSYIYQIKMIKAVSCVPGCDTGLTLVHSSARLRLLSKKQMPCSTTECVAKLGPTCWDNLSHHRRTDVVFHCGFYTTPQLYFSFCIVLLISL